MKTDRFIAMAVFVVMAFIALPAFAQSSDSSADTREQRRAHWESMSEEERAAKREERHAQHEARRAERENMSEEERAAKREERQARHEERRAKWANLSDEERAAKRDEMRARREVGGESSGRHGDRRGDKNSRQGRGGQGGQRGGGN